MKNNLDCRIVQDLLPSYVDGLTCEFTNHSVEEHIQECPECFQMLQRMKETEIHETVDSVEVDYMGKIRNRMKRWKTISGTAIVLLILTVIAGVVLYDRMVPKEFAEVFSEVKGNLVSCELHYLMNDASVRLEGEQFQEFLELLENADYYYGGRMDEVLYGDMYFIEMYDENENQSVFIQLTDEYNIYYNDKAYDFRDDKEILDFIIERVSE